MFISQFRHLSSPEVYASGISLIKKGSYTSSSVPGSSPNAVAW